MRQLNDLTYQITTEVEYAALAPYLTQNLGLTERERAELLAENEGPIVGFTDSGAVWGQWPPCHRSPDDRAFQPSSAGGVVDRGHPLTRIVRTMVVANA